MAQKPIAAKNVRAWGWCQTFGKPEDCMTPAFTFPESGSPNISLSFRSGDRKRGAVEGGFGLQSQAGKEVAADRISAPATPTISLAGGDEIPLGITRVPPRWPSSGGGRAFPGLVNRCKGTDPVRGGRCGVTVRSARRSRRSTYPSSPRRAPELSPRNRTRTPTRSSIDRHRLLSGARPRRGCGSPS